jgi:hypothetical protein
MTEKIVTASDTSVGGDADEGGIAQNITLDDIRAVAVSPAPLEQRKARLKDMNSRLHARLSADRGNEFGPLLRGIDDALASLDSAGGEAGTRAAYGMDEQDWSDAQPPGGKQP